MAKKHFDKYFNDVCDQYLEMLDNLKEMSELAEQKMISPEQLEGMKKLVEPIKNNYMTLSYVMYLLNIPANGKKQKRYLGQNKKFLEHCKTETEIKSENN